MWPWLQDHLGYAVLLLLAVGWKYGTTILGAVRQYFGWQREYQETQERLAAGYLQLDSLTARKLAVALAECEELKSELRRAVREKDLRDDAGRQDRATIRKLKSRLRDNKIDCSDIDEEIHREFQ